MREKGESEAANRFTQDMTSTLKDLYIIIAPWDIDKCLMKPDSKSATIAATKESSQQSENQFKCMPTPSPGTTWAAIAATEPVADSSGLIKFRPSDGIQIKASEQKTDPQIASNDAHARRVVWIRPWTADRPLKEITKKMQNIGAIFSIAFAPAAEAVCIIFQQAACAADFMRRCAHFIDYNGRPLFGADHDIAPGLPFPATPELLRMDMPYMERRRLTFARAGLFTKEGVTQQQFKQDIEKLVGPTNVELLWFFNSGNGKSCRCTWFHQRLVEFCLTVMLATVVFSAVPLSTLVRTEFKRQGCIKNSPYFGIMVTYSHDPCERDMHLVSQIPGHPGYIGGGNLPAPGPRARGSTFGSSASGGMYGHGGNGYYSPAHKRRITGSNGSKPNTDDDGWQTVKKRR